MEGMGKPRFAQCDPAVYSRFLEAAEELAGLEDRVEAACSSKEALDDANREGMRLLTWIFGEENDFAVLTGGQPLMAMTGNGQRVITNLLLELLPLMQAGVERCIASETEKWRKRE